MLTLLIILALVLLTFTIAALKKTYSSITVRELKRRTRSGDQLAATLYRAVSYGRSLNILLWLIIGLSSVSLFIVLARSLPAWLAAILSLAVFWFSFAWQPNSRVTALNEFTTKLLTPVVAWLLRHCQPLFGRLGLFLKNKTRFTVHNGVYEKEDLLELLKNQKSQIDNRISKDELRIASGALKFGDKTVHEVMTPRRAVKMVKASDSIGPVLMADLHKSGHSRFPVYEDKKDNLVGILYLHDLVGEQHAGKVQTLMKKQIYYVNEDLKLGHVLQAILKTKHHLFVAVNEFEDMTGVITIEDILEQIIGQPIMDEFDKYEDLREVAKLAAAKDNKNVTEVVE